MIRSAAAADPEIGSLWARIQTELHANQRAISQSIADKNALASHLDVAAATDILWALNHPNLYRTAITADYLTPTAPLVSPPIETPNPRTISFYERHGFEVTSVAQAGACPPVTSMLRDAR